MDIDQIEESKSPGFKPQKVIVYNKLLPYEEDLVDEALVQLKEIKENLSKSVILRDVRQGCVHWVSKLSRYIKLYGLYFSKEDHILFVKLAYELLVIPDQELWITVKFSQILNILLKKKDLLSPEELVLPWKPLEETYLRLFHSSYKKLSMVVLPLNAEYHFKSTIQACRSYFPVSATAEILNKWRPQFCIYDASIIRAVLVVEQFLPTMLPPEMYHLGWKLWFDDLMDIWTSVRNVPSWSLALFRIFSRLSWHNIGRIDWEPYLPLIFTRVLWQFHLPVKYKEVSLTTRMDVDVWAISKFIVSTLGGGSRTQEELNRLFKTLESYFHPSNFGHWNLTLNEFQIKLTNHFIQRLHNERYRKPSWMTNVPEDKKLSEDDITQFVKCLQPTANLAIFSKGGSGYVKVVLHHLAFLRPEIIIPPLLDQLYSALETMTEPHRLTGSLNCVIEVVRPLVLAGKQTPEDRVRYPEGPSHVIPLLFQALPGIDPNDFMKCMVTFQFISTIVSHISLVDCSSAVEEVKDLSEREQELCLQTAEFENFVLQFTSRALLLVESLTLDQFANVEREKEALNLEENTLELGLIFTFLTILKQSHPRVFDSALECLLAFTKGRCMETKFAGKIVASMWRSAAKVDAEKTLNAVLPGICRLILALTDNPDVVEEENLDDELVFNILLLSELVQSKGSALVRFMPSIVKVLERTLHLKCRKGYEMASSVLQNLLTSLSGTNPSELRSSIHSWDTPFTQVLPIRHWGESGDIHNLHLKWDEPGEEEEEAIQLLVRTFLTPELKVIKKYIDGDATISRDRLHQSLCITQHALYAGCALPLWEEEAISLYDISVNKDTSPIKLQSRRMEVTLDCEEFPSNVRKAVAQTILALVDFLLSKESDDTKTLNQASSIYITLCFFHGVMRDKLERRRKSYEEYKKSFSDGVVKPKQCIRVLLIQRTHIQYDMRIVESKRPFFTQTHQKILHNLFRLSTSHYSEVRSKAQSCLGHMFRQFPHSYKLILPSVIEILKKDPVTHHKEVKGALYVILGTKETTLMSRKEWMVLRQLFPALLAAQHAEKPSILRLYDFILNSVFIHFELDVRFQVTDAAVKSAKELLESKLPSVSDSSVDPVLEMDSVKQLQSVNNANLEDYLGLVKELSTLLQSATLHWRRTRVCLNILGILIRQDVTFPTEGVKAMMSFLISDHIVLRKIVIHFLPCILKTQKRAHKKIKIDPYSMGGSHTKPENFQPGHARPDVQWMQYDKKSIDITESEWNKKIFVHKSWNGWYCWPDELEVYAPAEDQPPVRRPYEQLPKEERAIYDFFLSQDNVDKLINLFSLEETKGRDKFRLRNFFLFKGLFRNFGDAFLGLLQPHLERMVTESQESSQRCAAEIIAGLVRGSKHWPYESAHPVLLLSCQLLKVVFSKVMNESLSDWGECFMRISMDRDPNRLAPIVELLLEDPIRQGESSFLISSRLYLTTMFLQQQEWRVIDCNHRLFKSLEPHFSSPYKSIRDRLGLILYIIFMIDESSMNGAARRAQSSLHSEFIESLLPQLSLLIQECRSGGFFSPDLSPHPHAPTPTSSSSVATPPECPLIPISLPIESIHQFLPSRPESPKDASASSSSSSSLVGPMSIGQDLCSPGKASLPNVALGAPGNGFEPGDTEERKVALRLMNTFCQYLNRMARISANAFPPDLYKLLPHLCQIESIDSDLELRNNCVAALASLSKTILKSDEVILPITTLRSICQGGWWRARIAALSSLQVMVFNNMFTILESGAADQVRQMVLDALEDGRAEVRQMASQVLSGLFHCNFLPPDGKLLDEFTRKLSRSKRKRGRCVGGGGSSSSFSVDVITESHCGALGLSAFIGAYPYDVPPSMPEVIVTLSEHINDPQPISTDIKQALSHFRRTHYDNWNEHKKKFTTEQLCILTDVLVSPSYYA